MPIELATTKEHTEQDTGSKQRSTGSSQTRGADMIDSTDKEARQDRSRPIKFYLFTSLKLMLFMLLLSFTVTVSYSCCDG